MEGGGIVQADALAQFGKPDAVAVARDLFDDREGAADRLHAAARRLGALGAEVAERGNAGPRWSAARGLLFGSRGHLNCLPLPRRIDCGRSRSRNRYFCGCDNAIGTLTISVTDRQYRTATLAPPWRGGG